MPYSKADEIPAGFGAAPVQTLSLLGAHPGLGGFTPFASTDTAQRLVSRSCPNPLHPEGATHKEKNHAMHMLIANRQLLIAPNHG